MPESSLHSPILRIFYEVKNRNCKYFLFFYLFSVKIIIDKKGGFIMNNISDELKKIILAGIGAAATTAEKSKEVVDQLVKKGELTVEQGKVLNEELKHNIKEKLRTPANADEISKDLEKVSKDDLAKLKAKIEELEKGSQESSQSEQDAE